MRETLEAAYPKLALGLGGVFSIRQGQAKFHVMPDFSPCPINTNEVSEAIHTNHYTIVTLTRLSTHLVCCEQEVNQWLKFYTVSAPLTVLSVFVSRDPGLDLRVEHSHGWGEDGAQGGLYLYYFTTARH